MIRMYLDGACTTEDSIASVDSSTLLFSSCVIEKFEFPLGCSKRYTIGGLDGLSSKEKKRAVAVYDNGNCDASPVQVIITNGGEVSQTVECIDDDAEYAETTLGYAPYLVVDSFANGTDCLVPESITIYTADGECHPSVRDGNYFKVTRAEDGAVTITTYPSPFCSDPQGEPIVVRNWFIDTETCYEGSKVFRTSRLPLAQTPREEPATPAPTPLVTALPATRVPPTPIPTTRTPVANVPIEDEIEARLKIMFPAWLWDPEPPRVFVSDGRPQRHDNLPDFHRSTDHRRSPDYGRYHHPLFP